MPSCWRAVRVYRVDKEALTGVLTTSAPYPLHLHLTQNPELMRAKTTGVAVESSPCLGASALPASSCCKLMLQAHAAAARSGRVGETEPELHHDEAPEHSSAEHV